MKNIELSVTTSQFSLTRILIKNDFLKDKKNEENEVEEAGEVNAHEKCEARSAEYKLGWQRAVADYQNLKKETEERPLMRRVALHAHSLSFKLMDGNPITVEAPYPKDFNVLTKQLEKFS